MNIDDIIAMRQSGVGLDRMGERWTDEERRQVEEAYYKGIDISQIAWEHGRSELAIIKQLDNARAFRPQGKNRSPKNDPCKCYRCPNKRACPIHENYEKSMCIAKETAHV